ncbi:MAG: 30S ribosomal protein S6 [Planctomycetota bacterium]
MSTRLYEGMFLFDANESARRWAELEERVESIFSKNDAKIQYAERWPDQRLAYEINGVRKGTHYLTYFTAPPENVQQIRRDSELTEDIMRVLVLHEEGLEDEMARRKELAEKRKSDASARAEAAEAEAAEAPADAGSTDDAPVAESAESEGSDDAPAEAPASDADAGEESETDRS